MSRESALPDAAPVARVSLDAIERNARSWLDAHAGAAAAVLPYDAWGHGRAEVGDVLRDLGVAVHETTAPGGAPVVDPVALYGLPGGAGRPAMSLHGRVLGVKALRAGEGVSYGFAHRAAADTRVALVTGGYAQGVVRALGGRVDVAIGDATCRIVGRVAMDVCVVDLGEADVRRGDEATFFGDPARGEPSVAAWGDVTGLRPAELVAGVGLRTRREHTR